MPWLKTHAGQGLRRLFADCVVPSFTNPNNLSIVTGAPPAVHGICGNYLYDTASRHRGHDERPQVAARADDPRGAGRRRPSRCAVITAKDKLRTLARPARLAKGTSASRRRRPTRSRWPRTASRTCSSWSASRCPSVYSADLSEFVFAAGVKLMRRNAQARRDVPVDDRLHPAQARARHARRERLLRHDGRLPGRSSTSMGCVIALTADHGMNAKTAMDGTPDVIYLQDRLDAWLGARRGARDPADHRPLRRAPRRARLVRHRLPARTATCRPTLRAGSPR